MFLSNTDWQLKTPKPQTKNTIVVNKAEQNKKLRNKPNWNHKTLEKFDSWVPESLQYKITLSTHKWFGQKYEI